MARREISSRCERCSNVNVSSTPWSVEVARAEQRAPGAAAPRERRRRATQRAPCGEHQDPDDERPLRAGLAEECERVQSVGERCKHDVQNRSLEINVTRRRAGHRVDEGGQRVNRGREKQDHQRDRNRVAAQQVHSQIPRMSGRLETSGQRRRTR